MFSRQSFWGAMWMAKQRRNFQTSTLSAPPSTLSSGRRGWSWWCRTNLGWEDGVDRQMSYLLSEPGRKKNRQFFVKLLTFSKISPSPRKVSSSTVQQVSHQSSKLRESRFGNHIGTTPRKLTNIVWRTDDWKMRSSFEKWRLLWETVPEKNIQKYAFCQSTLITESYCHMIILNRCQPWSANR